MDTSAVDVYFWSSLLDLTRVHEDNHSPSGHNPMGQVLPMSVLGWGKLLDCKVGPGWVLRSKCWHCRPLRLGEMNPTWLYLVAAPVSPKQDKGSKEKARVMLSSWPTPLCSLPYTFQSNRGDLVTTTGLFVALDPYDKPVKQAWPDSSSKSNQKVA